MLPEIDSMRPTFSFVSPTRSEADVHPHFVLFYVESPTASVEFYREPSIASPIEASPDFRHVRIARGLMLGLWARDGVRPADKASAGGGGSLLAVGD